MNNYTIECYLTINFGFVFEIIEISENDISGFNIEPDVVKYDLDQLVLSKSCELDHRLSSIQELIGLSNGLCKPNYMADGVMTCLLLVLCLIIVLKPKTTRLVKLESNQTMLKTWLT